MWRSPSLCLLIVSVVVCAACAAPLDPGVQAERELAQVAQRVPALKLWPLPSPGELVLTREQSVTIENLRGVALDSDPPKLGERPRGWDPRMVDDYPPGQAPYVAKGVAPFRFRYFNLEFNYGGWHNWGMDEYASTHGFNILASYNHKPADWPHVPRGTQWLLWGGFVDWDKWLPQHGLKEGDWGQLVDLDLAGKLVAEKVFAPNPGFDYMMVDIEHWCRPPENLRQQAWYPKDGSAEARTAFETHYYQGYAKTNVACMEAARQAGYHDLSIYGWAPVARGWYGLESVRVDPKTDFAWNAYGKVIYDSVDLLNPSVYAFYWCPQNVAYTLASVDLNMQLTRSAAIRKPVRPYYWTCLHGGGGDQRWWTNQPMPTEELRAMMTLFCFTGAEGLDQWNWSGTGDHHHPGPLKAGAMVMVGKPFTCAAADAPADKPTAFGRYDVLGIKAVTEGMATFQLAHRNGTDLNAAAPPASYTMKVEDLSPCLRPTSEAVAGVIEGLALAKPFEFLLRHGEVKIDVSAQEQYAKTLPIVRRVKLGKLHLLATYDPKVVYGEQPREIVLKDFDGHQGLTVRLPADEQVRVFVLREP